MAEYCGKPLLSITAADLGHSPAELEEKLLQFFHDAQKWNAIVLLDEADVYLQQRAQNSEQNNNVSGQLSTSFRNAGVTTKLMSV